MVELSVNKKTIKNLFSEMQNRKFVIPYYQRPYNWDIEKCETLWNDIVNFYNTEVKKKEIKKKEAKKEDDYSLGTEGDYFLGTIVSFKKEENEKDLEIIDGQQRITSLLLLLRAFYRKLEDMKEDDKVVGLKNQIAPCIWDIDPISQKVYDKTKIHIVSFVATEQDNNTFHKILEKGITNDNATDNYSINYQFLKNQCDNYARENPLDWKMLCLTILQNCIILPIECAKQDTALTIFSTLNDRGMPLSDSDIFKAQIYRNAETEEKRKEFTEIWTELMQICEQAGISINDVFRYYTHILRARNEDNSKEIGLRRFYTDKDKKYLENDTLMEEIMSLANFWVYINDIRIKPDNDYKKYFSLESRKFLQCLSCYPNEYWKYVVSVFFIKNKTSNTFDRDFIIFLEKLTSFLFAKFIESPTVNSIKNEIYSSCISINKNNKLQPKFTFDRKSTKDRLKDNSSSKLSKALLLLDAYLNPNQKELIPEKFEIEHIVPKKRQGANYNWIDDDAKNYFDCFGNKVVIEKKINIKASNNYFGTKKQEYKESSIANIKDLSKYKKNDWTKEDIKKRETKTIEHILEFFEEQLKKK